MGWKTVWQPDRLCDVLLGRWCWNDPRETRCDLPLGHPQPGRFLHSGAARPGPCQEVYSLGYLGRVKNRDGTVAIEYTEV